ncbi:hypothetical protein [Streptomyces sp. NPDC050600]|uniref:hypothetical protein n=1 Tax=Streptomyces sp. NPDC050600 TaxID=3157213 RepID=UPI00342A0AAA
MKRLSEEFGFQHAGHATPLLADGSDAPHIERSYAAQELMDMRALTIRQPYADAIIWGGKRTENRVRALSAFHLGATVLIHAAKATHASEVSASDLGLDTAPGARGAIIGTAVLDACHQASAEGCCAPWGMLGFWHWTLRDVRSLPRPVEAAGRLGLWVPAEEVVRNVLAQSPEPRPVR